MTRRQKGEGSITQLSNGKYRVRIEVEPTGNQRKWVSKTVGSKTEAVKVLRKLQRDKEDNLLANKVYKVTFGELIDPFITYKTSEGLRNTTLTNYEVALKVILEFLEYTPISKITTDTINDLIDFLRDKGLSENSVRNRIVILKEFFKWLIKVKRVVSYNPVTDHKTIRTTKTKKNLKVLDSVEHHRIMEYLKGLFDSWCVFNTVDKTKYRLYPLYLLLYETGMRKGELLGLKWSHIDFINKCVVIDSNMQYIKGVGLVTNQPKTEAGYRSVVISDDTLRVLRIYKGIHQCSEDDYIAYRRHKEKTRPLLPSTLSAAFKDVFKTVGIDRKFTIHDIRHTNASLMIAKGIDSAVITERLGHSSINVTYATYAHVIRDSKTANTAVVTAL